ncbi:MAG: SDR family NAD(P)-dependent oxidoreductase [Reichenbachiella sp.]
MKDLSNKWVLITGASSGLGEAMATELASRYKCNLLLVARRKDKLESLANKMEKAQNVSVECLEADLIVNKDIQSVIDASLTKSTFFGAILNAGRTHLGKYVEQPIENQLSIVQLNIESTIQLTDAFVKHFEQTKKPGRLSVISSLAAQVPAPYQAVYSGTKAFLTNFFHSVKHELKNKDLKLSVFSPGGIKTEMTNGEGFKDMEAYLMPVNEAAQQAVNTFLKGKHNHIPGFGNRLGVAFLSLIPTRIFSKVMGKKYLNSIESLKA